MSEVLANGWIELKFTDVFDIQGGTQPPKKTFIYEPKNGYIRLLQIRDFGNKPLPTYIPKNSNLKKCNKDDILIGRYGASVGRICTGMEGAYNVALAKVIIPKEIPYSFVKLYLYSYIFQEKILSITRSAQDGFNKNDLAGIPFFIPPLNEQKRIVTKLDIIMPRIESVKARLEKVPNFLKRFRQSVLTAAVTGKLTEKWREEHPDKFEWDEKLLGDILISGPQNGLYKSQDYYGNGVLILRIDNFYNGFINSWDSLKRLALTEKEKEIYELNDDDIVINRVNSMPFLGKSALVRGLVESCVFESNMMRIKLDKNIVNPEFLIRYLNCQHGLTELRKNAKHAVNQSSINQQDVKAVNYPIPSLEEQNEIIRQVDKLFALADKVEGHFKKAKAKVDNLSQSVLVKAFRGELVPQDPNDEPAERLLERIMEEKAKLVGRRQSAGCRGQVAVNCLLLTAHC